MILDTETTIQSTVADFGAVVVDRNGKIFAECGVLVAGEFGAKPLFHDETSTLWNLENRTRQYEQMLNSGARMLASIGAINRWIDKAINQFDPELTAYNLAFDLDKCKKTGIDLSRFRSKFCLWHGALGNIVNRKAYLKFCLENHYFTGRTDLGNMSVKTSAECVYQYLTGDFTPEPHTALEDAKNYELPILQTILRRKKWRDNMRAYNWRNHQVKDYYSVK